MFKRGVNGVFISDYDEPKKRVNIAITQTAINLLDNLVTEGRASSRSDLIEKFARGELNSHSNETPITQSEENFTLDTVIQWKETSTSEENFNFDTVTQSEETSNLDAVTESEEVSTLAPVTQSEEIFTLNSVTQPEEPLALDTVTQSEEASFTKLSEIPTPPQSPPQQTDTELEEIKQHYKMRAGFKRYYTLTELDMLVKSALADGLPQREIRNIFKINDVRILFKTEKGKEIKKVDWRKINLKGIKYLKP